MRVFARLYCRRCTLTTPRPPTQPPPPPSSARAVPSDAGGGYWGKALGEGPPNRQIQKNRFLVKGQPCFLEKWFSFFYIYLVCFNSMSWSQIIDTQLAWFRVIDIFFLKKNIILSPFFLLEKIKRFQLTKLLNVCINANLRDLKLFCSLFCFFCKGLLLS